MLLFFFFSPLSLLPIFSAFITSIFLSRASAFAFPVPGNRRWRNEKDEAEEEVDDKETEEVKRVGEEEVEEEAEEGEKGEEGEEEEAEEAEAEEEQEEQETKEPKRKKELIENFLFSISLFFSSSSFFEACAHPGCGSAPRFDSFGFFLPYFFPDVLQVADHLSQLV